MPVQGREHSRYPRFPVPRLKGDRPGQPVTDPDGNYEADYLLTEDDGCDYAVACLNCPFSMCVLEGTTIGGKAYTSIAAELIRGGWHQPGADRPQLFKAAEACLSEKPGAAKRILGPSLLEELDAYRSAQGSGPVS